MAMEMATTTTEQPERLELPRSLSPSKVSSFTDCALAFRFSAIDRLPEPPSAPASKGTLVHLALQMLFRLPPAERTVERAVALLDDAWAQLAPTPDIAGLDLQPDAEAELRAQAVEHVRRYFELEDPTTVHAVGLEVLLGAEVDGLLLRGIIDRLDWVGPGQLVVTDYKTGKAPGRGYERSAMLGVRFYALLCEKVLGVRPVAIQLLYLGGAAPEIVRTEPTERNARGVEAKAAAVWQTIQRAHATDAFRPKRGFLCDWCSFQQYCPEFGGDPVAARAEGLRLAAQRRQGLAPETPAASPTIGARGAATVLRTASGS